MKEFVDVLLVDVVACISMLVGFATTLVFRYKTSVELHKGLLPGSEKDAQEDGVWYGLWTLFRKIYTIPDYPSNMGGSQTPLIDDGSNGSGSESSWPTSVIDRAGIEGVLYLRLQVSHLPSSTTPLNCSLSGLPLVPHGLPCLHRKCSPRTPQPHWTARSSWNRTHRLVQHRHGAAVHAQCTMPHG